MRWRDTRDRVGNQVYEVGASPGRPRKLTAAQEKRLVKLLLKGPLAYGHSTDLWTCRRIAELIRKEFRIRYHRDHVGRLMKMLGWSYQKPQRRALERDEDAIRQWKSKRWPQPKKTPRGWAPISSS